MTAATAKLHTMLAVLGRGRKRFLFLRVAPYGTFGEEKR